MAYTTAADSYTLPPSWHSPTYSIPSRFDLTLWLTRRNGVRVGQVCRRTASALWSVPPTGISCVHLPSFVGYTFWVRLGLLRVMMTSPIVWLYLGDNNPNYFSIWFFCPFVLLSLITLILGIRIVKSFLVCWPSMVTVVLMRFLLAYR